MHGHIAVFFCRGLDKNLPRKNPDTAYLLKLLEPKAEFSKNGLRSLSASYMHHLRERRIKLLNGRIIIMNPIGSTNRFLTLIIVPKDLRRIIFHAYHTTPICAHMTRYKTLLLVRLRFSSQEYAKASSYGYKGMYVVFPQSQE